MARKPKSLHGQATKKLILEAARRVVLKGGVEAVNTNHVAQVAGVSVGSIYQYYKNKNEILQELLLAVLASRASRVKAAVSASMLLKSPEEIISRIIDALFESDDADEARLEILLLPLALTSQIQTARELTQKTGDTISPLVKVLLLAKEPGLRNRDLDVVSFVVSQALRGIFVGRALPQGKHIKENVLKNELKNLFLGVIKGTRNA